MQSKVVKLIGLKCVIIAGVPWMDHLCLHMTGMQAQLNFMQKALILTPLWSFINR